MSSKLNPISGKNLGHKVTTRSIPAVTLVQEAWGAEWRAPDHDIYNFSNGRHFDSTDKSNHGFYAGGVADPGVLTISNSQYPDMAPSVLQTQDLDPITLE